MVGHSKGGNLMLELAEAQPYRFSRMVNLDGIPTGANAPDVSERDRTKLLSMATKIGVMGDRPKTDYCLLPEATPPATQARR